MGLLTNNGPQPWHPASKEIKVSNTIPPIITTIAIIQGHLCCSGCLLCIPWGGAWQAECLPQHLQPETACGHYSARGGQNGDTQA